MLLAVLTNTFLFTSHTHTHIYSSFHPIKCADCGARIGRVYRTAGRDSVSLLNLFTLDLPALRSFPIGRPQLLSDVPSTEIAHYFAPVQAFDTLTDQYNKMQQMMLLMFEELEECKKRLASTSAQGGSKGRGEERPKKTKDSGEKRKREKDAEEHANKKGVSATKNRGVAGNERESSSGKQIRASASGRK